MVEIKILTFRIINVFKKIQLLMHKYPYCISMGFIFVFLSQNVKAYTCVFLFCILQCEMYYKGCKRNSQKYIQLLFTVHVYTVYIYTHTFGGKVAVGRKKKMSCSAFHGSKCLMNEIDGREIEF